MTLGRLGVVAVLGVAFLITGEALARTPTSDGSGDAATVSDAAATTAAPNVPNANAPTDTVSTSSAPNDSTPTSATSAATRTNTATAEHAPSTTDQGADASVPRRSSGQENFGFGAQIGDYNPSGAVLRVGARAASLEVSGGFVPVLLSYGSSAQPDLKFIMPLEVSSQLLFNVITFQDDWRGGLRLGYRYNVALGHGLTLGGQVEKRVTKKISLQGIWGLSYYLRATDQLRGKEVPADAHFNFPPEIGGGISVGFLFFP